MARTTYRTPRLMAIITPIFSFLLIRSFQMSTEGKMDKVKSMAAEYASGDRQRQHACFSALDSENEEYLTRTAGKSANVDRDVGVPAGARGCGVPSLPNRAALDEQRQTTKPHGDVERDDDEPDHVTLPRLNYEVEQRNSE